MATIGALAIRLSLNDSAFTRGLTKAADQFSGFGSRIAGIGRQSIGDALGGKGGVDLAVDALKGGIGATTDLLRGLTGMIPGIGPLLSEAVGTFGGALGGTLGAGQQFLHWLREMGQSMQGTARMADTFGISTEKMSGLMAASGEGGESLAHAVAHFGHELGQAQMGSKEAQDKFSRLGPTFRADALAAMPLDQALGRVFGRIRTLPTAWERLSTAQMLFGRGGHDLLPTIMRGSEALQAMQQRALDTGEAFSRLDAEKMAVANKHLAASDHILAGLKMRLAVELLPTFAVFLDQLGDAFQRMNVLGSGTLKFSDYLNLAGFIAKDVFGMILDGINALGAGFNVVIAGLAAMTSEFVGLLAKAAVAMGGLAKQFDEDLGNRLFGIAVGLIGRQKEADAFGARAAWDAKKAWDEVFRGGVRMRLGLLNLDDEANARLKKLAGGGGPGLGAGSGQQFSAAMEAGTKEAMSTVTRSLYDGQAAGDRVAARAEEQRNKQIDKLADIVMAIRSLPIGLAAI